MDSLSSSVSRLARGAPLSIYSHANRGCDALFNQIWTRNSESHTHEMLYEKKDPRGQDEPS